MFYGVIQKIRKINIGTVFWDTVYIDFTRTAVSHSKW